MKITFVIPIADLSGGIRVVATYAQLLKNRGHQVTVVSAAYPKPSLQEQIRSLLKGNGWIKWQKILPSHLDSVDVTHQVVDHPVPLVDSDIPDGDIVIATWWETAEWISRFGDEKGTKVYLIQHHEVFDYLPQDRVKATYALPFHKITISRWLVNLMREEYGDATVSLVPNSVDTKQFYAPRRQKQTIPTVGLLYSSSPWKGSAFSLKAFLQVAQAIPDLKLVAFGHRPPLPDMPLPENTEYITLPEQDRIKDIYTQCDVWLCGSQYEGFNLPLLEAMACRCPIVTTEGADPADLVHDGVNGYRVPTDDLDAFSDRLLRLLTLPNDEWLQFSDAAYATATRYSWDDATDRFEAALLTAIEREQAKKSLKLTHLPS